MLRPLVWSLAVLALVVAFLLAVLESEGFARWAEEFAEQRASRYLGRKVEIGSLSIDLVPLAIEARQVVIAGIDSSDSTDARVVSPPFAEVERLLVYARLGPFIRPGVALERVFVEKPVIRVGFDESGRHEAPRPSRRLSRSERRRFEIAIGLIEVVEGQLETEHRKYPLEISARDLKGHLEGVGDRLELGGHLRADDVFVELPSARPYLGTVSIFGSYRPGRLEVASGKFAAPDLKASAEGFTQWRGERMTRFSIEASGRGRLLDRLGYGEGLIKGPFEFAGEFVRGEREWSLAGGLTSEGVKVIDRRLSSVQGRLQVDRDGARYRIERARYGGGKINGSIRMGIGSGHSPVELDLRLTEVDVQRLLDDQRIPVTGLSATASGGFSYQFARSEPRSGNGWADLSLEPKLAGQGLPVQGSAVLSIADGRLRTEAVRLTNDEQQIVTTGSYDLVGKSGRFDVEVATESIESVLALLPLSDAGTVWQPNRGRGAVSAEVVLDGDTVGVLTEMNLDGVVAPGFRADRFQGRFELDSMGVRDLRVELLQPAAGLIVTGSVPLGNEDVASRDRPLSLAVDAEGWPLSELQPWLPFELPVDGPFSGGVTVHGSLGAPSGAARGRVTTPALGTLTASSLDFDLDFSSDEVVFHEVELGFDPGAIRLRGGYDLLANRVSLEVDSDRLALGRFGGLPIPSERLEGTLEVSGEIGGSTTEPAFALLLRLENVSVDGVALGPTGSGELRVERNGREIRSEGEIEGVVRLTGGGTVEDGVADLTLDASSADLRSILALFVSKLPDFAADGRGRLMLSGALATDRLPAIGLVMDELSIRSSDSQVVRTLENLGAISIALQENVVELNRFNLTTPDGKSELFVKGRIGLDEEQRLDLKVQSTLPASWLAPWIPEGVRLEEGLFQIIGSVGGTMSEPSLDGLGEFKGGTLVSTGFPLSFESTEAVFLFYPGQAVLDQLSTQVAGGRLKGAGTVGLGDSVELDYQFQFSGEGLNLRYPEGWSMRGNADFTLSSIPGGRQLTGALELDRALYVTDVPVELDQLLRAFFEQRRVEVEETEELLSSTQLNLAVIADESLRIRNNLADLRGSADLVLRGSLARPVVFGTVELDPSGRLIYSGNQYDLERGLLTFANPYRLEPVIDLVAHTGLREYDVTLSLSGTPERLSFDFTSDPPLAELEVMALMTGGQPRDPEFGRTRESQSLQGENLGAEGFLYGQATSLVANRFNRLFGLDQFRIDPLTSSTGELSSARVTVGKQLSRDLFATYSYDRSESEEQIFELDWNVSRSLVLVLTQNGDGTYAVDTKWEKAF